MIAKRLALGCLFLAACGPGQRLDVRPNELLFLAGGGGVSVIKADGDPVYRAPAGLLTAGGNSLLTATSSEHHTDLKLLQARTGKAEASLRLPERLELAVASAGGELAALVEPRPPGTDLYDPPGKSRSRLTVADLTDAEVRRYSLRGNFEPEAFAADGKELFLIQYLPALAPARYRVMRLRLGTGQVLAIGRGKLRAPEEMAGTGRTQVAAPNGNRLYTLYTRQPLNSVHGAAGSAGNTHAFVHVLDLRRKWAHCVDLPSPFGTGNSIDHAIATSADGTRVYVMDRLNGAIAVIDTGSLEVVATARLKLSGQGTPSLAAGAGGFFAAAGNTIYVLNAQTLRLIRRVNVGETVTSLAASRGRDLLYATTPAGITVLDESARAVARLPGTVGEIVEVAPGATSTR